MEKLNASGVIIYLQADYETVAKRMGDPIIRGVIGARNRPLNEMYKERMFLYEKWADITVNTNDKSIKETMN